MNKLNIALMHTIQASRILVSQSTLEAFEGEQKGRSSGARGSRKGFPFSNPPPPTFPSRTRIQVCGFTVSVLSSSSLVSFAAVIRVVTQALPYWWEERCVTALITAAKKTTSWLAIIKCTNTKFCCFTGFLVIMLPFWLMNYLWPDSVLNRRERRGICYEPVKCCTCLWHIQNGGFFCCRLHMLLYKSRSQGLCFSRLLLLQRAWGRGNIGRPNNLRIIGVYIRFQLVHACTACVNFTLAVIEYLKTPIFIQLLMYL